MQKATSNSGNHRRIILIVVILIFFLCGVVTIESLKGYHDELRRAAAETQSLANAVSQNATGTFGRVDLLLAKIQEVLILKEEKKAIGPIQLSEFLRREKKDVPEVEVIGVTDGDGKYIGNTTWVAEKGKVFVAPQLNASDREYFKQHRDHPEMVRFISEPVVSRSTGNLVLAVVRKRFSTKPQFNGVIFATLNLKYFSSLFEKMNPAQSEVAALWNSDRVLLARYPFTREELGKKIPATEDMQRQLEAGQVSGTFTSPSAIDGIRRVFSFHVVEGLPLMVTVGRGEDEVLSSWRRHLLVITSLCAFIIVLTVVSLLYHFRDLKELDRQRAIAFEATKMSSLGEMAAGIAHEINNPLAIIAGRGSQILSILNSEKIDVESIRHKTERIIQTSMRAARIIRGLRSFARNSDKDPMIDTKISTIVENTLELSQERFRAAGVDLRVNPIADCSVICRESQISQVLINLLNNAYDAVSKSEKPWVELEVVELRTGVRVALMDSGSGIPDEIADKLMQPFFTTKDLDKGTGLGLSISKGIIEEHGGTLELDRTSTNTRFVVTLPKAPSHL